jgi:protein arginine kinase activator
MDNKNCSFCQEESIYSAILYDQGVISEVFFCEFHARNYQSNPHDKKRPQEASNSLNTVKNNINNIIKKNFLDSKTIKKSKIVNNNLHCPECDMDKYTIAETGIFGCDFCYTFFEKSLKPRFPEQYKDFFAKDRILALSDEYPVKKSDMNELEILKGKLECSVKKEDYIEAAKIRDRIKLIENPKDQ